MRCSPALQCNRTGWLAGIVEHGQEPVDHLRPGGGVGAVGPHVRFEVDVLDLQVAAQG